MVMKRLANKLFAGLFVVVNQEIIKFHELWITL